MAATHNQRTIGREIRFSGRALQTGKEARVVCGPASPDEGIVFRRADIGSKPAVSPGDMLFSDGYRRRSAIGAPGAEIQTVEHFLAALWGLEIDNITVDVHGVELPALDGSALGFLDILKQAGIVEQPAPRRSVRIKRPLVIEEADSSLAVLPGEKFSISYFIEYDCASIGTEEFGIELDRDSFEREIAPARTFCLKKEAEALLKAGLGGGANCENTLVMDDDGPAGTCLRFPNEPVRHKILDLVGDLYLLGVPIIGKVVAKRSGHRLNLKMVKKIHEQYFSS